MALNDLSKAPRCQHIHYSGKPCRAPARRGRNYCMFHQSAHNEAGHLALPIIEDTHSMQLAILRILHSLANDYIDPRRASVMLYGLQLAGMNMKQFCQERLAIENPEAQIAHRAYAEFLTKKMKLPVPTAQEVDKLLDHANFDMPADPCDYPPPLFPQSDRSTIESGGEPAREDAS